MSNFYNTLFQNENATNFILPDTTLRYKIRVLMTQYSPEEIGTTLHRILEDDNAYYQSLVAYRQRQEQASPPQPQPEAQPESQPHPPPQPQPEPQLEQQTPLTHVKEEADPVQEPISNTTKLRSDTKIRVIKKPVQAPPMTPIPPAQLETNEEEVSIVSGDRERKAQIKREQAEKESAKYKELVSKGVDPETLLTKENLKKWIEVESLTYAQIARDHVGLSALQVSNVAKGFGFKSLIAKKRAMIIASRK